MWIHVNTPRVYKTLGPLLTILPPLQQTAQEQEEKDSWLISLTECRISAHSGVVSQCGSDTFTKVMNPTTSFHRWFTDLPPLAYCSFWKMSSRVLLEFPRVIHNLCHASLWLWLTGNCEKIIILYIWNNRLLQAVMLLFLRSTSICLDIIFSGAACCFLSLNESLSEVERRIQTMNGIMQLYSSTEMSLLVLMWYWLCIKIHWTDWSCKGQSCDKKLEFTSNLWINWFRLLIFNTFWLKAHSTELGGWCQSRSRHKDVIIGTPSALLTFQSTQ